MSDDRSKTAAIVARCRTCQGITYAAVVDEGYPAKKAEIADLVAAGFNIEHTTVGVVRASEFCFGECGRPKRRTRRGRAA